MFALEILTFFAVLLVAMPVAWLVPLWLIAVQWRHRVQQRAALVGLTHEQLAQTAIDWPFLARHQDKAPVRELRSYLTDARYDVILRRWRDLRLELIAIGDNRPGLVEFTRDGQDEDLRDLVAALRSSRAAK